MINNNQYKQLSTSIYQAQQWNQDTLLFNDIEITIEQANELLNEFINSGESITDFGTIPINIAKQNNLSV